MRIVSLVIVASLFGVPSVFYGDALGLDRLPVILWTVVGSMIGVTVNLLLSDWIATRLRRRADAKGTASRVDRVSDRAQPVVDRFGVLGLGLAGPMVLGTFGAALVAPVIGVSRPRAFLALLLGVTVWCVIFGIAADLLTDRLATNPDPR
jgi:uncharacterized membrane protein